MATRTKARRRVTKKKSKPTDLAFPRYLIQIGLKKVFLPLAQVSEAFAHPTLRVEVAGMVLHEDFTVHPISSRDREAINRSLAAPNT